MFLKVKNQFVSLNALKMFCECLDTKMTKNKRHHIPFKIKTTLMKLAYVLRGVGWINAKI